MSLIQPCFEGEFFRFPVDFAYFAFDPFGRCWRLSGQPSLYFAMSLGLTYPMNILQGIPLYVFVAQRVVGGLDEAHECAVK